MTRVQKTMGWAWMLSHARLIKQTAYKFSIETGVDVDDFHSELVIRVVEKHSNFNKDLSSPATWVWWQAKAVAKLLVHRRRRRKSEVILEDWHHPTSVNVGQFTVMLHEIKKIATSDEWIAATAVAAGFKGAELGAICGCAPFSAKRRVTRLLERVQVI